MKNATPKTVRITITVPAKVQAYLEGLMRIGLYGNSIAEVAAQLVCEPSLRPQAASCQTNRRVSPKTKPVKTKLEVALIALPVAVLLLWLYHARSQRDGITLQAAPSQGTGNVGLTWFDTNYEDLRVTNFDLSGNWHLLTDYTTNFLTISLSNRYMVDWHGIPLVQFTDEEWRLITNHYPRVTNVKTWFFNQ